MLDQHLKTVKDILPITPEGCQECIELGTDWVHLRLCRVCGHVGCCNDSDQQHARKHHESSGHEIIASFEPGEDWAFCYQDDEFIVPGPLLQGIVPFWYRVGYFTRGIDARRAGAGALSSEAGSIPLFLAVSVAMAGAFYLLAVPMEIALCLGLICVALYGIWWISSPSDSEI